jgi:hypothetical protein
MYCQTSLYIILNNEEILAPPIHSGIWTLKLALRDHSTLFHSAIVTKQPSLSK